jgi:hypothetical protein
VEGSEVPLQSLLPGEKVRLRVESPVGTIVEKQRFLPHPTVSLGRGLKQPDDSPILQYVHTYCEENHVALISGRLIPL